MGYVHVVEVDLVTATGGGATGYTPVASGKIDSVEYVKDGTTPMASTSDLTITKESTGEAIGTMTNANADTLISPRKATVDTAGAAAVFATGGAPVLDQVSLANDRVKIVVAQGGNTKNGKVKVTLN
jgi:hypothetical protein|tara:strand:- start:3140 stop:3520 length:381 start_codon:yes stop_codon:yes gene_type:complete